MITEAPTTPPATVRLTQYSHGAGCGCKISPQVLGTILQSRQVVEANPHLLVGNDKRDDAAVFDLGDGTAMVSTTDFFMPIVDDPFDFGRIAAVNAISDVYAMGGSPLMAIAILGWPVDKLAPEVAQQVLEGGRSACREAGIPLAGGHSIDSPEPIFGLAVSGRVQLAHLRQNSGAKGGDVLYLTKKLGVGILSTAQKKGILEEDHAEVARDSMVKLNRAGETFGRQPYIHAMTDVTGFGLLGHLIEMCEGSGVSAEIDYEAVPHFPIVKDYITKGTMPGGTGRNFDSYGIKVSQLNDEQKALLCDPQTSGGLLVAVDPEATEDFEILTRAMGFRLKPFGRIVEKGEKVVTLQQKQVSENNKGKGKKRLFG